MTIPIPDTLDSVDIIPGTNKISAITNNQGSTAFALDTKGDLTFGYQDNRLVSVTRNTTLLAACQYNHKGLRTRKTTHAGTTLYHYDTSGLLISETQEDGTVLKEYIYLENTPLPWWHMTRIPGFIIITPATWEHPFCS